MSGVPPQSFDKVEDPEIRDIIERCIRLNKEDRPSIKQLLAAEFFAEDTGFKLELLNREHLVSNQESMIKFRLKVTDQRKLRREKPAHKENEHFLWFASANRIADTSHRRAETSLV